MATESDAFNIRLFIAYSDETGHCFRFIPDTFRSEATLEFHYTSEWPEWFKDDLRFLIESPFNSSL